METFHLKEHSSFCPCKTPYNQREPIRKKHLDEDDYAYSFKVAKYYNSYLCEKNPRYFLFQLSGKFHLIVYYDCIARPDYTEFFTALIKQSVTNTKGKKYANIRKSIPFNELLNDMKKGLFQFKNYHEEIIHIYKGSFKVPQYCITRKTDYFERVFEENLFRENYLKAIDELKKLGLYELLKNELYKLYESNIIPGNYYSDKTSILVTNELIKQINKIANGND
jgi:uncharacterized protein YqgQ